MHRAVIQEPDADCSIVLTPQEIGFTVAVEIAGAQQLPVGRDSGNAGGARDRHAADELLDQHSEGSHEDEVGAKISIDRLLHKLPEAQALAIRLVKIDGLSISEACARCGQSEPLVKVNIHRGLKKLATLIESE